MSHELELQPAMEVESTRESLLAKLTAAVNRVNHVITGLATIALLAASFVLTLSVVTRYFLKMSTDWQDEASVFLIVGSVFMCGGYVQSYRGHIGIEALANVLPRAVNRIRLLFIDIASFAFCVLFSWKSWAMFREAFVEGQTTSSTWAPPLWIPYGLLTLGMANLSLQLLLQISAHFAQRRELP